MAAQSTLPKRGAGYPKRPPFFFHRFTRLLAKTCAAQHVGPDGAWFLASIASIEDSAHYKHAIAWTDEQASPMMGVSPSTLKRIRARCVQHGWLHYEQGFKGVPSLYWVSIPPAYDILDGQYLDCELAKLLHIRVQDELESGRNPNRIQTECELESGPKADTSIPLPPASTTPAAVTANAGDGDKQFLNSTVSQVAGVGCGPDTSLATSGTADSELLKRLKGAGIRKPKKAIDAALGNGLDRAAITAVVDHFERHPGYWEPWALWTRLTDEEWASQPPDAGWPAPSEKAVANAKALAQREATQKLINDTHGPAAKTQQVIDWDSLEQQFGAAIDAASIDELCELLPADIRGFHSKRLRRIRQGKDGRHDLLTRQQLLKAFSLKAQTT